jgi:DNA (cytosine-5)-methyltransferase 1
MNAQSAAIYGRVDYKKILDDAWQLHLQPRKPDAPTVISLFAGCGGSSLGYSMAGYKELLAVEWDDRAVDMLKANFPCVPVYHDDIAKLSVEECMRLAGLTEPGQLDVLDGSPPCQGFSTAGKRQLVDSRNRLFEEYVRLLEGLQPKVFVMENVSGLVKGKMKLVFAEIMKALKATGYNVRCQLMNTMYFNVPQSRQRLIWIGLKHGKASFPKAISKPIVARDAIPGLMATRSMRINPRIDAHTSGCATICKTESDYQGLICHDDLIESAIKSSWQMSRVLKGIEQHKHFGLIKLNPNKPCPTIMKDAGNTTTGLVHPLEIRKLTIPEIKRLSSFPDHFSIDGKYKDKWARIGNSVPPLFMKAIAEHIRRELLTKLT